MAGLLILAGALCTQLRMPVSLADSAISLTLFHAYGGIALGLAFSSGLVAASFFLGGYSLAAGLLSPVVAGRPDLPWLTAALTWASLFAASALAEAILRRWGRPERGRTRARFLSVYFLVVALLFPALTSLTGLLFAYLTANPQLVAPFALFERLFVAKLLGCLVGAPLFVFGAPRYLLSRRWPRALRREQLIWVLLAAVPIATLFALVLALAPLSPSTVLRLQQVRYFLYPLLIWSALRLGSSWTKLALSTVCFLYLVASSLLIAQAPQFFARADLWLLALQLITLQLTTLLVLNLSESRKRSVQRLRGQFFRDWLTSLPNHRSLEEHLDHLERSDAPESTFGELRVGGLGSLVSAFGLQAQVQLLHDVAGFLTAHLPPGTFVAHLPVGSFILVTRGEPNELLPQLSQAADAIGQQRFEWDGQPLRFATTLGVLPFQPGTRRLTDLLADASQAVRLAAEQPGRQVFVLGSKDPKRLDARRQVSLLARVLDSLERGQVELYGQPILAVAEDSCERPKYEVLVRLRSEKERLLLPGGFIPLLEDNGKMPLLDRLVLSRSLEFLAAHPAWQQELDWISLNFSGQTLDDAELVDFLSAELARTGVPATRLCLEVTETAIMRRLATASDTLGKLRDLGCYVALDDFGTGLSSFRYLRSLPVDLLKIDGSFVRSLRARTPDHVIVRSVVDIARQLGMQTVAESVENRDTVFVLRSLGVDLAQGFLLSEPRPLEHWTEHPPALDRFPSAFPSAS
jgi:EAL domain-containing protein (putative c-di-GMP-specific phosphodiesterase class I)/GGDEF domain-containing protein